MPISNGKTWMEFDYGGTTYTLPYVNVSSYDQKPAFSEDGFTMLRYEVTLQGTALVSDGASTFTDLATKMTNMVGTVDRMALYVIDPTGTKTLIEVNYPDAMRGPYVSINVTEISGARACIVSFTVNASVSLSGQSGQITPTYPVIANRWTTRTSLDANGIITRTVMGTLTVDLAATGTGNTIAADGTVASINNKYPWADLFRKAILPSVPATGVWRRESQTFAYNEAGNSLIYELVDSQARTNLPDGAFVGNAEFTYERNRQNLAMASLRFSCDLEGPADGNSKTLIYAAILLSQTRIPFAKAIVNRISVTEQEMLKKSKIRLEVDAMAPAANQDTPGLQVASVPLVELIGHNFTVTRTCPYYADPYGGNSDYSYFAPPHWDGNDANAKPEGIEATLPVAQMISAAIVAPCAGSTPTVTILANPTNFTAANNIVDQGVYTTPLAELDSSGKAASVERQMTFTSVTIDTNMHRLQTLYTQGADFVFQTGKAAIVLEETTHIKRFNKPPERSYRPMPTGFVVLSDDWNVNHGDIDPSGNRVYTGIWKRRLMSFDAGGATYQGYYTNAGLRQWWQSSVAAPYTLGFPYNDQQANLNVFAVSAPQAYPTGAAQNFA